jgi:hypothetical protein
VKLTILGWSPASHARGRGKVATKFKMILASLQFEQLGVIVEEYTVQKIFSA